MKREEEKGKEVSGSVGVLLVARWGGAWVELGEMRLP
jgi:hypothetical protein